MVLISIVSAGPALMTHNADLFREQVIQLLLAAIATALCLVERSYARKATDPHDAGRSGGRRVPVCDSGWWMSRMIVLNALTRHSIA